MKLLKVRSGDARFPYMRWFADAWEKLGLGMRLDCPIPRKIRAVCGRLGLRLPIGDKERLLVCAGHRIESVTWPWNSLYEIVPVMWDLWPPCYGPFVRFVKKNKVKVVICTSSQQVARLSAEMPQIRAIWMPEGIEVRAYPTGGRLGGRTIDILEYGRRNELVHRQLTEGKWERQPVHMYRKGSELLFPNFETLTSAIRNSKISICYPMCDTQPEKAGDIETLTQRYWEAMLSGTLIAGRAPRELIELCGYNPVIELGARPIEVLSHVLSHVEDYQELADRNRAYAEQYADWTVRVSDIVRALQ